ncbi:Uncharacterised protein [Vibrio cholerae]|uniref:Uncharacterized protein n=1 Tax=Vibrio cholerae TaxID=666 RepID=A0A655VU59_VIBCL|nr:Uncharacterised protein [Vibrio cholerae]CSA24229.1 Uncharacterised protein [Vibrio cholerae]CSA26280.1 Uncharacterised protein [Vibrio cholerae]CSB39680.1 Uncharacterised protein [Vibrio cholerae]CSB40245.1 Uncharacterised protein [Vibrio cholerae]
MQQMQVRVLNGRQHFIPFTKGNITALIIFNNLRFNMLTASIWRGVHVGNKANRGHWVVHIRWEFGHHIAMIIQRNIT